jgi:Flp pilus assembly pilin Flp
MELVQWLWVRYQANRARLEQGQALMEYELVIVLVAIILIVVLGILGGGIKDTYQFIVSSLP